jgi:hypothetical protein
LKTESLGAIFTSDSTIKKLTVMVQTKLNLRPLPKDLEPDITWWEEA